MDLVVADNSASQTTDEHANENSHLENQESSASDKPIVAAAQPPHLQIATASIRSLLPQWHTWARVVADGDNEFVITAPADGWVRRLYIKHPGQTLTVGESVFEFFSPELYQRQRDYIDILSRRDQLVVSMTDMSGQNAQVLGSLARERKRQRDALLRIGISPSSIDTIEQFRRPLDTLAVASPYAGIVTAVDAREGATAGPGTALFRAVNNDSVFVDVVLTPTQMAAIQVPARIKVSRAENDEVVLPLEQATFDTTLQSYTVRVAVPKSVLRGVQNNAVPVGAVLDVDVMAEARNMLAVPRSAVLEGPDGSYVVVQTDDKKFITKKVLIETGDAQWAGIAQGLQVGEHVVTEGQFLLDAAATFQQTFSKPLAD
jgi:multidrug resistance efflux pump